MYLSSSFHTISHSILSIFIAFYISLCYCTYRNIHLFIMDEAKELNEQHAQFEQSQKIREVVAATVAATQKIGGAILKVASDILSMFRK